MLGLVGSSLRAATINLIAASAGLAETATVFLLENMVRVVGMFLLHLTGFTLAVAEGRGAPPHAAYLCASHAVALLGIREAHLSYRAFAHPID
jgi:hypothetical protein